LGRRGEKVRVRKLGGRVDRRAQLKFGVTSEAR
jgi:hypothetical protein